MPAQHDDFYKRLRKKVQKWARSKEGRSSEYSEYILLAPDLFHLLLRLSLDKDVAVKEKAKLAVAIAYFLSPIDLLPEWLVGPIGYLDDVGLAVYVLHSVLDNTENEIVLRHWAGDADLLETVRSFMTKGDELLGSGLWGRLRGLVEGGQGKIRRTAPVAKPTRSDAARATERRTLDPTEKAPEKRTKKESGTVKKAPAKKATQTQAKKATSGKAVKKTAAKKASKGTAKKGDSKT